MVEKSAKPVAGKKAGPSYKQMVIEAVKVVKVAKKGSSRQAVFKHLAAHADVTNSAVKTRFNKAIRELVKDGFLKAKNGNLSGSLTIGEKELDSPKKKKATKPKSEKPKKAKKAAAPKKKGEKIATKKASVKQVTKKVKAAKPMHEA